MVLTASQCDAPHIMSLSYNASAYAAGLRLTMLHIYLYQYWTVAETQKKGRSETLLSCKGYAISHISEHFQKGGPLHSWEVGLCLIVC